MLDFLTVPQFKMQKKRMKICSNCEYKVGQLISICSICNCVLKTKTILTNTKCPKGKW